ncbi:hypothetical protein [Christiangramia sabulilitoris]|uniref:DUF3575 domain-containing protein n=1 Tax=Christiangramia sabulilitoris TaxID=2583991 RepID=A0A550I3V9_9FLAO|nr:hypothetical protein [Christiangramia sabulilitoris]TRO65660.1 hypothetical protein FGM01_09700 [Christiangramia sabulilitoris]
MKRLILLIFIFNRLVTFGQDVSTNSQFSLNLLAPSAEYEIAIAERSTVNLDLGVGFAYHRSSYSGEAFGVFPGFEVQYRQYYNFTQRADKGRKISENSANYIAGIASITGGKPIIGDLEYSNDYGVFIGPAWGLQRVYYSGFKLNLNLGLGLGFNEAEEIYFTPLFGLQLGWVIIK